MLSKKPFVIGICGGTCSGKTTICDILCNNYEKDITSFKLDSYYKGGNEKTNFDHPDSLDWTLAISDLVKLIEGYNVNIPSYDFTTHSRSEKSTFVKPKRIIVVEGILIFYKEELRKLLDLRIFVEAGSVVRYQRRLGRDTKDRGRTEKEVITRWNNFVGPCHDMYVEPTKQYAHITIHNNQEGAFDEPLQAIQLDMLMSYVDKKLSLEDNSCVVGDF
jgi:uridine kinase